MNPTTMRANIAVQIQKIVIALAFINRRTAEPGADDKHEQAHSDQEER